MFPLPWNPSYKSAWRTFLTAFAARYASNPAFVSIAVAGPTAASAEIILPQSTSLLTDGGGGLFNELGCFVRMRHIGHMARLHFDRLGLGALRHHALLFRID